MAQVVDYRWAERFLKDGGFTLIRYLDRMESGIRCDICGWIKKISDYEMATGKSTMPMADALRAHECKPIMVKDLVEDLEYAGASGMSA